VVRSADSLFVNPANFDLHLAATSSAIDKGTSNGAPFEDFDGNPRPFGNAFDIGAYEYQYPVKVPENSETFSASRSFYILRNYPNPFNSKTVISYRIAEPSFVEVEILNIYGQSIKKWENNFQSIGLHRVIWEAKDNFGNPVPSGEYLCRITNGNKVLAIKLLYLK
ncbi:MAG TPA: choice-of-anchor Q domain-containing protein, partial [bacterium]